MAVGTLSADIRQHVYNIYGFVRLADEIVDSFHDFDKVALLNEFEQELHRSLDRRISVNPILNAFQHTYHAFGIPIQQVEAFMKSMRADLDRTTYDTREAFEEYIYGSADVVGLMCLRVFVKGNQTAYNELEGRAMRLGSAFQKVNFLRDIASDSAGLSRSYFPNMKGELLTDVEKAEIIADVQQDFDAALSGIRLLPARSRFGVYLAYRYYLQLLRTLATSNVQEIYEHRQRVSDVHKLWLFIGSYVRNAVNLL
jgi:phytoene/squalene synthetase